MAGTKRVEVEPTELEALERRLRCQRAGVCSWCGWKPEITICAAPGCSAPIVANCSSHPRLYCSVGCRVRAHRARKRAA
ncbi:MAG TPA: hypothetical protein VKK19_05935 [Candidatus Dormibacteraeota bacterium]|nr:hypothetical protein [Candidatus Dormibacteraeota bacterium]